jgi:hypothetical protein
MVLDIGERVGGSGCGSARPHLGDTCSGNQIMNQLGRTSKSKKLELKLKILKLKIKVYFGYHSSKIEI